VKADWKIARLAITEEQFHKLLNGSEKADGKLAHQPNQGRPKPLFAVRAALGIELGVR